LSSIILINLKSGKAGDRQTRKEIMMYQNAAATIKKGGKIK
jgi:hypothetical protein